MLSPSLSGAAESSKNMAEERSVVAAAGAATSVAVTMHPLVIMNISEHWTRLRAQNGKPTQVLGAVLGKQHGRHLELINSFEMRADHIGGHTVVDKDFFRVREAQYKEVFGDLDFLGWYTTGDDEPNAADVALHNQVCELNESPVFLKLNPQAKPTDKLPLRAFESVVDLVAGEARVTFVGLSWTLATDEAERVGVDHVARISVSAGGAVSAATKQLLAQHGAVKMMLGRLQLLLDYARAVESGELPRNDAVLRRVAALCARLPAADGDAFRAEFDAQCGDIKLMGYLGALTKTCGTLHKLIGDLNVLSDRHGTTGMRRARGLLM